MALSDQLAELSKRAKAVEDRAATARAESRAQLDADIADARAQATTQNEKAKARLEKTQDDAAGHWAGLQAHVREQFDQIHSSIDERRAEHDVKTAERRAERAEWNATEAVYFAEYAVDEAEAEVLAAIEARQTADQLAHATA